MGFRRDVEASQLRGSPWHPVLTWLRSMCETRSAKYCITKNLRPPFISPDSLASLASLQLAFASKPASALCPPKKATPSQEWQHLVHSLGDKPELVVNSGKTGLAQGRRATIVGRLKRRIECFLEPLPMANRCSGHTNFSSRPHKHHLLALFHRTMVIHRQCPRLLLD